MCTFDPQRISKKFRAGGFAKHRKHFQKYIEKPQMAARLLIDSLVAFQKSSSAGNFWDDPMTAISNLEKPVTIFVLDLLKAVAENRMGFVRATYDAMALVKNNDFDWYFSVPQLIFLALVHLREEKQEPCIITSMLRDLIEGYLKATLSDNWWRKVLKHPGIPQLLAQFGVKR